MTWTLIISRPGKDTVYKDYTSWHLATDAMIVAMQKMEEPVAITLTNPNGHRLAHLEINPVGVMVGGQFIPFIECPTMPDDYMVFGKPTGEDQIK
jgi:hypothetical protein